MPAIKTDFKDYWEDYESEELTLTRELNLTILHQIVLGLVDIDLRTQLSATTTEINTRCSTGRSPLAWATALSNVKAVQLLLKFGANPYINKQPENRNLIYEAAREGSLEVLSVLLESLIGPATPDFEQNQQAGRLLNQVDSFGLTPLHIAIINRKAEHIFLLLQYQSEVNPFPGCNIAAILLTIQCNMHDILHILLAKGVRTDVKDGDQMGVLHLAAEHGDLKTILILLRYNKNTPFNTSITDIDINGNTPMKTFDMERKMYVEEDAETFAKSREAFVTLLNNINAYLLGF